MIALQASRTDPSRPTTVAETSTIRFGGGVRLRHFDSDRAGACQLFDGEPRADRIGPHGIAGAAEREDGGAQELFLQFVPAAILVEVDPHAIVGISEETVAVAVHAPNGEVVVAEPNAPLQVAAGRIAERPGRFAVTKENGAFDFLGVWRGDVDIERSAPEPVVAGYQVARIDAATAIRIDIQVDVVGADFVDDHRDADGIRAAEADLSGSACTCLPAR